MAVRRLRRLRRHPRTRQVLVRQSSLLPLLSLPVVAMLPLLGLCGTPEPLLEEDFSGDDGVFVSAGAFWNSEDLGEQENPNWLSESGALLRRDSAGRVDGGAFRMWTRNAELPFSRVDLDVTFHRWKGGSEPWHGINLWLNASLCLPAGDCSRVDDTAGGNGGYALDFMNRDGSLTILKKVPGDTRGRWPGATSHTEGGTYYQMASTRFHPGADGAYRFTGSATDDGRGGAILQVLIDGKIVLEVVDDGSRGGPALTGGRVGLRTDSAVATVDDLEIHHSRRASEPVQLPASASPQHRGGRS